MIFMSIDRENWLEEVEAVIRSRHYTWLPEGLGGEPVDVAMTYLLTDIMHVCNRTAVSFDQILDIARKKFREEEREEKQGERGA
jgi:hypothetical protein